MNQTQLTTKTNVTTITNKKIDNTVISISKVNSISSTKIRVTTIGRKGDTQDLGVIARMNKAKGYIEFTTVGEFPTKKTMYSDETKTTKLYETDFTFLDGILTQKIITEIETNLTVTYNYNYTNGDIPKITIS